MSTPMPPKLQKIIDELGIKEKESIEARAYMYQSDYSNLASFERGFNHCWEILGPLLKDAKKELEVIAQYELGEEYIIEEALFKINSLLEA